MSWKTIVFGLASQPSVWIYEILFFPVSVLICTLLALILFHRLICEGPIDSSGTKVSTAVRDPRMSRKKLKAAIFSYGRQRRRGLTQGTLSESECLGNCPSGPCILSSKLLCLVVGCSSKGCSVFLKPLENFLACLVGVKQWFKAVAN